MGRFREDSYVVLKAFMGLASMGDSSDAKFSQKGGIEWSRDENVVMTVW